MLEEMLSIEDGGEGAVRCNDYRSGVAWDTVTVLWTVIE